ncbi:MAG: zeta toxin family protein [Candidatus Buchananbacteria bacterium]|nr:zeta toxin family protein [Candidatus Buchananbacteria bacterium]
MTDAEQKIWDAAILFAQKNKKRIAKEVADSEKYPSETLPVSVFMSGSPGAGKTEASKNLIAQFASRGSSTLRIDPDELRSYFDDYSGGNAALFQGAVSILVSAIHDQALKNSQSFIFDGTLSKYPLARQNIDRSLKRGRFVQVLYVYQDPAQAWEFVKERQRQEGRHIPKTEFIEQYFLARQTVNQLKIDLGSKIWVNLLVKNIDGTDQRYYRNIDLIDNHVKELYTRQTLDDVLK